jgi:hypothetical protein
MPTGLQGVTVHTVSDITSKQLVCSKLRLENIVNK